MSKSANTIEITDQAIDTDGLSDLLANVDAGAQGWFYGVTRRKTGELITERLAYEAHESMAIKQLTALADQAVDKFDLLKVVIVHRVGEVPVGQTSVALGCCAAHRREVFAALPWMMDQIKLEVPIWKREQFVDGTRQWIHPSGPST